MIAEVELDMLDTIAAASLALPPPQSAAFCQMVTAHLASLPCVVLGPGTLHRVIADERAHAAT
jgi:hypothetical protein